MTEGLEDVGLIIVGAGGGTRLGAGLPKALVEMAGMTLVEHVLSRLAVLVGAVVVVVPEDRVAEVSAIARRHRADAVVVAGGATRSASVSAGLAALPQVDLVAVHDAARPLADGRMLASVAEAVRGGADAAAPGLAPTDTVKHVRAAAGSRGGEGVAVLGTLDREALRLVQTPQVFRRDVLVEAHHGAPEATDDLALVEAIGGTVVLVSGSATLLKITHQVDLLVAEALATSAAGRVRR